MLNVDLLFSYGIEMNLWIFVLILDDYLLDVYNCLMLYKCIVSVDSKVVLKEFQVEMIDCFGLLLDLVKNLMCQVEFWLQVEVLGIVQIDVGKEWICLEFGSLMLVDLLVLVKKV